MTPTPYRELAMQNTTQPTRNKLTTITVVSEFGTFTRKTARIYQYVVIVTDSRGSGALSWCGRYDLAEKALADRQRHYHGSWGPEQIAIVRIQDGGTVRTVQMGGESQEIAR